MPSTIRRQFERLFEFEASLARRWAAAAHRRLFLVQWGMGREPEHFDHSIDLFYRLPIEGASFWLERGVFGSLAMKGGDTLELACGDGFNAKHFYAGKSRRVVAVDFDPAAIRTARRKNPAANVTYMLADIREGLPVGGFANVVWDAAIEHFTQKEIRSVLCQIKTRLTPDGILSGYTIVAPQDGSKMHTDHEYEFADTADLERFLTPHFRNVRVFETECSERRNLYWWASDGAIPFSQGWQQDDMRCAMPMTRKNSADHLSQACD
jgi:SAM-dependent methyltransferase